MKRKRSKNVRPKRRRAPKRRPAKTVSRAHRKRARGTCPCKGGCCVAAGMKCACKCHGRHHGARIVRANPPARPARIDVYRFGVPESITYRRADGSRWRHSFGAGCRLLAPKGGGSYVVIDGVKVNRFLEG